MQAGFGEVIVTPPLGTAMAGYFHERLAEGIVDDLYSRALVVSQGDTYVALVVTDLIGVPVQDMERMRQQVALRTGIPSSHVLLAATHSHTGPVTQSRPGFHRDDDYMRTWARLTAGAVELAFRNRVDVTVGVGKGRLPGVAFNRRFRMRNGYVHTNPGVGNPDVVEAGPTDPEVVVVRFDGPDGLPIGVVSHFACHCDTVGGNRFSADWVGVAVQRLRELLMPAPPLGKPLGVVIVNGPCGDINHINVGDPGRRHRWPNPTQEIGIGVAAETARVAAGLRTVAVTGVAAKSGELTLQLIPVDEFLAQSRRAIEDPRVGSMEKRRAQANLDLTESLRRDEERVKAQVLCLRIGPAIIATAPGELFCELGLAFKQAFPENFPMVANLANGYLGYIPTARTYEEGGYENRSSRLQPGSGEKIIDMAVSLARDLLVTKEK